MSDDEVSIYPTLWEIRMSFVSSEGWPERINLVTEKKKKKCLAWGFFQLLSPPPNIVYPLEELWGLMVRPDTRWRAGWCGINRPGSRRLLEGAGYTAATRLSSHEGVGSNDAWAGK